MIIPNSSSPSIPNLDKVGNLIIYLVDEIYSKYRQPVFLTKLLKLLYIIDELAVKETGAPVTGLDYRVWKMGPVAFDIYSDLMKNNSEQLGFFAETKKPDSDKDWALINSVNKFNDSDFSDYEMDLLDKVIQDYGQETSENLITRLHEDHTLWSKIVKEKNLVFDTKSTSSHKIDFSHLIADDPQKLEIFKTAQDALKL